MNTAIRRVSLVAMAMVVALVAQLTWVQVFRAEELRSDPRNTRMLLDEYSRQRGQISAGGRVIAVSQDSGERYRYARSYPGQAAAFGPVVGYYSLQYATAGIEQSQDAFLAGSDDRLFSDRIMGLISGRTPRGGNVELTLDPEAQTVAFTALQRGAGQGPFVGAVAAVRPSTGEVLALASSPSFDPNALSSQDPAVSGPAMGELTGDPGRPLLNHATQQSLPPGSTMKVITAAAALSEGMNADTPVSGADRILLPGTSTYLENYAGETCGGGRTTLRVAFANSCNVPFVELSEKIGADRFRAMAEGFGLDGGDPEFPVPLAPSGTGPIADPAGLAMASIGQNNVRSTTLASAMVAATVANKGVRMQPQLLRSLQAPDLSPIQGFSPKQAGRAVDEKVASQLTDLMLASERHSQTGGGVPGVRIASKTGTAEHGEDSRNSVPYTWYIGFVPDRDVAVAVLVESGPGVTRNTVGATYAAPIGREVLASLAGRGGGQR